MEEKKGGRRKRDNKESISENSNPLDNIRQQERIEIIACELMKVKSKHKIQEEYMEKWGCTRKTINVLIKEAMFWILETDHTDREQMRALNANRLDYLLDEATTVKDKAKLIDLLNRIYGLYDTNVNLNSNENISIDIGV